jgi:hypothetical protein
LSGPAVAAAERAESIRRTMRRYGLVFLQCGTLFEPLREALLSELGTVVTPTELLSRDLSEPGWLVVDQMELFTTATPDGCTLGQVRERIVAALDAGSRVCLASRAPRVAFPPVAGSSVLEDATFHAIPILKDHECSPEAQATPTWPWPTFAFSDEPVDVLDVLRASLRELDVALLAVMDQAIFEAQMRGQEGLALLSPREIEGLRGAGLVVLDASDAPAFAVGNRTGELADALADVLADVTVAQESLAALASDLWQIERLIRRRVRRAAIEQFGVKWRAQVVSGDLPDKVLDRARGEAYPGAVSIKEVRDPLEWLTLGELLEVATKGFGGLGLEAVVWRKFAQDVLPARNRLSHMRLPRRGDRELVAMWVVQVRKRLS